MSLNALRLKPRILPPSYIKLSICRHSWLPVPVVVFASIFFWFMCRLPGTNCECINKSNQTSRCQLSGQAIHNGHGYNELAHQYFYYLILKDPFATAEQNHGLAEEVFSRAFGEKPGSHFEVTPEMLHMASVKFNFLCSNWPHYVVHQFYLDV